MIRSLLVGISPDGPNMHLPRAIWIAQQGGSELILLCVAPRATQTPPDVLEQAREYIRTRDARISVKTLPRVGNTAWEILKVIREWRPDLLLLGVSDHWYRDQDWFGEKAFHRYLLRSVAAKVAQEASCPVWLESPLTSGRDMGEVLCVLNLDTRSEGLVRYAAEFAELLAARLTLFHGVISAKAPGPGMPRSVIERQRELICVAERKMADIQRKCGTAASQVIEAGEGLSALSKAVEAVGSRLLIMDSVSNEWGSNDRIYGAVRMCGTSVLIRRTVKESPSRPDAGFGWHPALSMLVIWLAIALGVFLIHLAIYQAKHTDNCHLAPMRCDVPPDFIFPPYDDSGSPD